MCIRDRCMVSEAPGTVEQQQLDELGIKIVSEEK